MIKYNTSDKDGMLNLEVKGDVGTIAAEVVILMSKIYSDIKATNPDSAKEFKEFIIMAIKDGVVFASEEERKDIIKVQLAKKVFDFLFGSIKGWKDDTDTDGD